MMNSKKRKEILSLCSHDLDTLIELYDELSDICIGLFALHYMDNDDDLRRNFLRHSHEDMRDYIVDCDKELLEIYGVNMDYYSKGSYYLNGEEILFE